MNVCTYNWNGIRAAVNCNENLSAPTTSLCLRISPRLYCHPHRVLYFMLLGVGDKEAHE